MRNILEPVPAIIRHIEQEEQEIKATFIIVNFSEVKENDFNLSAEFYLVDRKNNIKNGSRLV